jgi:hypothetical protein
MRGARDNRWQTRSQGMLFERCRSIHTFGMRESITIVALDSELRVRRVEVVRPRRVTLPRRGVRHILECRPDADVRLQDRFVLKAQPERRRGEGPTTLRPMRRWRGGAVPPSLWPSRR